jgi:hypothetical protein
MKANLFSWFRMMSVSSGTGRYHKIVWPLSETEYSLSHLRFQLERVGCYLKKR